MLKIVDISPDVYDVAAIQYGLENFRLHWDILLSNGQIIPLNHAIHFKRLLINKYKQSVGALDRNVVALYLSLLAKRDSIIIKVGHTSPSLMISRPYGKLPYFTVIVNVYALNFYRDNFVIEDRLDERVREFLLKEMGFDIGVNVVRRFDKQCFTEWLSIVRNNKLRLLESFREKLLKISNYVNNFVVQDTLFEPLYESPYGWFSIDKKLLTYVSSLIDGYKVLCQLNEHNIADCVLQNVSGEYLFIVCGDYKYLVSSNELIDAKVEL